MQLPWEIIDKILLYTDNLDIAVKLNRKYCIKYMRKIITNKFKTLHVKYRCNQDLILEENPNLYNFKEFYAKKDIDFKEINEINGDYFIFNPQICYHPRFRDNIYTINGDTIQIKLNYTSFESFNNLTLKFFNPDKKSPDYFIEYIKFEICGQIMYEIDDIYNHSNVFNQLFKRFTKHENDYTYLPLHFINDNALLYKSIWHESIIHIKTRNNIIKPNINCKRYFSNLIQNSYSSMIVYQNHKNMCKQLLHNNLLPIIDIKLNCIYPVYIMYLTTKTNNYKNIKTIELLINDEVIFNETLDTLNQVNNNLGYNFCCPVIIFSDIFDQYSYTTINFRQSYTANLRITLHKQSEEEYDINYIHSNILIAYNGMYTLKYSN